MKKFFLLGLICVFIFSCKKELSNEKQKKNQPTIKSNSFTINGTIEKFYPNKIYLNKIIENSIYPIDSSEIINNTFQFKGIVEYPERFALTFENYSSISTIIIENKQLNIVVNSEAINDPLITGSPLNSKLKDYKLKSKNIFKKIDYLFPQFQKARLENDAEKINSIGIEMEKIEIEFIDFSYDYMLQNKNSYIAAMILRDRLKSTTIDTLKVTNMYNNLSEDVKNCPDAQIIASFLNLH